MIMFKIYRKICEYTKTILGFDDKNQQQFEQEFVERLLQFEVGLDGLSAATECNEIRIRKCEEYVQTRLRSVLELYDNKLNECKERLDRNEQILCKVENCANENFANISLLKLNISRGVEEVNKLFNIYDVHSQDLGKIHEVLNKNEGEIIELRESCSNNRESCKESVTTCTEQIQFIDKATKDCIFELEKQIFSRDSQIKELQNIILDLKKKSEDFRNEFHLDLKTQSSSISDIENTLQVSNNMLNGLKNSIGNIKSEIQDEIIAVIEKRITESIHKVIQSQQISNISRTLKFEGDLDMNTLKFKLSDLQGQIYQTNANISKFEYSVQNQLRILVKSFRDSVMEDNNKKKHSEEVPFGELKQLKHDSICYSRDLKELLTFKADIRKDLVTLRAELTRILDEGRTRDLTSCELETRLNDMQKKLDLDTSRHNSAKLENRISVLEKEISKATHNINFFQIVLQKLSTVIVKEYIQTKDNIKHQKRNDNLENILDILGPILTSFHQSKLEFNSYANELDKLAIELLRDDWGNESANIARRNTLKSDTSSTYRVSDVLQHVDLADELKLNLPPEMCTPRDKSESHKKPVGRKKKSKSPVIRINGESVCSKPHTVKINVGDSN